MHPPTHTHTHTHTRTRRSDISAEFFMLTFETCIIHSVVFSLSLSPLSSSSSSSVHELVFIFRVCFTLFGFFFFFNFTFWSLLCCPFSQPPSSHPFHSSPQREKKRKKKKKAKGFFFFPLLLSSSCEIELAKEKKNVKCYRLAARWVPPGFFFLALLC